MDRAGWGCKDGQRVLESLVGIGHGRVQIDRTLVLRGVSCWLLVVGWARVRGRKRGLTSCVSGKGFFHQAVEDGACAHERLVHGYQVGYRMMFRLGIWRIGRGRHVPRFWLYLSINFTILGRSAMLDRYNS